MRILLIHTFADRNYLPRLKDALGSVGCSLFGEDISTRTEIVRLSERAGLTQILCSSQKVLSVLLHHDGVKKPSLDNYAGSLFTLYSDKLGQIEIVFINPLEHLVTVSYGKYLFRRYLSKFSEPDKWLKEPEFTWEILEEISYPEIYASYKTADLIAVDIETGKEPYIHMREVGYTAVFFPKAPGEVLRTHSCVCEIDSPFKLALIRNINDLPAAKILQNGKYDLSYLARYNAPLRNYLWDTATLMHCWQSELPKDLGFLGAFFSRKAMYWKDLAGSANKRDRLLYNCKDTYTTALAFLQMMHEIPDYAKHNYLNEFPLLFPCHMAEMTGIKRDNETLEQAAAKQKEIIKTENDSLNVMLGGQFNVASPVQMKKLLAVLGCKDLESADEKNLKKASLRHPLNAFLIAKIIKVRKARKLLSTYLTPGKEFYAESDKEKSSGRILYSLNPHGTDTGRLASKEHHFWCGLQVQNIPRGDSVKCTLVADDGYVLAECDLEQAESRDTAHVAGDENLIAAVSSDKDFHSVNASAFFGVPYDSIYDQAAGKTKDKGLRDLAKRVNHGANYLMGANVLVDTMGLDKIWEAQRLLKLSRFWAPKQVAEFLLSRFHATYPKLSKVFYPGVTAEINRTGMLSSKAVHDAPYQASTKGWTRYCFGKPAENKRDLNAYVAHVPQSLNAMTLNKAFMHVFYDLAFLPEFKLLCQIHDSILFQVKRGHEYLIEEVKKRMEIPVTITGYDGVTRTFTVPAAAKAGKDGNGASRWSETE